MGNQNATGIVGEEKEVNEEESHTVPESVKKDDLTEEKHILSEGEVKDFHENAVDFDHSHVEIQKHLPVEKLTERGIENNGAELNPPPGFQEVSEEANGTASEDNDAQTDSSKFHDQLSPSKGEVEEGESCLDSKFNLNSEPLEHINIPDESQEENEDLLSKESKETREVSTSCHVEEKCHLIDTNIVPNLNVEKNGFEVNEMASLEDAILDTSTRNENPASISEPPNAYLVIPEEMTPTVSELGIGENMSYYGERTQPLDKEINQLVNPNADQSETRIESESKEDEEEHAVGINSSSRPEKVDHGEETDNRDEIVWTESIPKRHLNETSEVMHMLVGTELGPTKKCIATCKENGDEEATNEGILKKEVPGDEENGHETDNRVDVEDMQEYNGCEQLVRECSIANVSYAINEIPTEHSLDNTTNRENELAQSVETSYIPPQGGVGDSLELRKSPSFDFGVSFDVRSEESDQTPLLYQDKTAIRSFSSCATLIRTSLQSDEDVEVEEKNIRLMERSNSENSGSAFLNAINKEKRAIAMYTEEKEENNCVDKKGDKDLQALESTSPKGNVKRRPKSSIFTTCICCTAAIS
ncbi:unnamed protein product [Fraxinus pennsylvanica]|uniref:Uncharacterized protein n=1 Tax=Fraxinus pennsylvanica TaxID=56036 RepID=A0AAD1ZDM8_9LAMI|nr:unnamed protein product [Fraxinus pennsylvanica]